MKKYTEGPWRLDILPEAHLGEPKLFAIVSDVASEWIVEGKIETKSDLANLALIAAAPELLESLQIITSWLRTHTGPSDGLHDQLVEAMAVIDKATGRTA